MTMSTETIAETAPAEEAHTTAPEQSTSPEPGRVPGFTIGDSLYTFPAHVPVGWGLTYLRLFYSTGEDHALVWVLGRLLGPEQVGRLENDPQLTRQALADATQACKRALLGDLEDPKGS